MYACCAHFVDAEEASQWGVMKSILQVVENVCILLQKSRLDFCDDTSDAFLRMQRSLATDLQAFSLEFRKQQKAYLQRLQAQQDVSNHRLCEYF
jgi:hypothetical protein